MLSVTSTLALRGARRYMRAFRCLLLLILPATPADAGFEMLRQFDAISAAALAC